MARQCRHDPCTCEVQGTEYCDPRCAEMAERRAEADTPNCECDHPACNHSGHS
jgi:hypothetical protein